MKKLAVMLFCAALLFLSGSYGDEVTVELGSAPDWHLGKKGTLVVRVSVEEPWHLYAHEDKSHEIPITAFEVVPLESCRKNFEFYAPVYPQAVTRDLFGESHLLYEGEFVVTIPVRPRTQIGAGSHSLGVRLIYQACSDEMCLEPRDEPHEITIEVLESPDGVEDESESEAVSSTEADDADGQEWEDTSEDKGNGLLGKGLFFAFLIAFLGGIGTSLTPCVYPMIPITIAFFSRQSQDKSRRAVLGLALIFVLGIATLYTAVGVITGMLKMSFNVLLQSRWVIGGLVAVLFLLGLSLFGLFSLQLPSFITSRTQVTRGGVLGAYGRGLFLGIIAAPCMGPVSIAILPLVPDNPVLGGLLLFVYACGVGVLFVVLALFSKTLPRGGGWLHAVEWILGVLIIAMALYFLEMLVSLTVLAIVTGVLWAALAVYLYVQMRRAEKTSGLRIAGIGVVCLLSLLFLGGFAVRIHDIPLPEYLLQKVFPYGDWEKDYARGMQTAHEQNRPVMVDVWAKWCIPCKEIDRTTFRDPRVMRELERFVTIKLDISLSDDKNYDIMEKYDILGPPSFIFFDSEGNHVETILGKASTEEILQALQRVR